MELSKKNSLIKAMRNRTGLPLLECRHYLEKSKYSLEEAIYVSQGKPWYVGTLINKKMHPVYVFDGQVADGLPVTREMLEDSGVQTAIKNGILDVKQPYDERNTAAYQIQYAGCCVDYDDSMPFESKEETEYHVVETCCPYCCGKFFTRPSGGATA